MTGAHAGRRSALWTSTALSPIATKYVWVICDGQVVDVDRPLGRREDVGPVAVVRTQPGPGPQVRRRRPAAQVFRPEGVVGGGDDRPRQAAGLRGDLNQVLAARAGDHGEDAVRDRRSRLRVLGAHPVALYRVTTQPRRL